MNGTYRIVGGKKFEGDIVAERANELEIAFDMFPKNGTRSSKARGRSVAGFSGRYPDILTTYRRLGADIAVVDER